MKNLIMDRDVLNALTINSKSSVDLQNRHEILTHEWIELESNDMLKAIF